MIIIIIKMVMVVMMMTMMMGGFVECVTDSPQILIDVFLSHNKVVTSPAATQVM